MMTARHEKLKAADRAPLSMIWVIISLLGLISAHGLQVRAVSAAREWSSRKVIVLDPGHGGADLGAVASSGLTEKAVTLSLARKIKDRLSGTFAVHLTRDNDLAVDIQRRTELANHYRADLFISIHAGGAFERSGSGVVVFLQGPPSGTGSNLPQQGSDSWRERKEPPPWAGLWIEHAAESRALAEIMHQNLTDKTTPESKGLRQAPVLVLEGADMPAVLVEVGYLTHPGEGTALGTSEGVSAVAESICRGIEQFFKRYP